MKVYVLIFSLGAIDDIKKIKKSDTQAYKKLEKLLTELKKHPYTGTGKPEQLKYRNGQWSRRISLKHRLIYSVNEKEVSIGVISAQGHYCDK